jgi:hypothetical protein
MHLSFPAGTACRSNICCHDTCLLFSTCSGLTCACSACSAGSVLASLPSWEEELITQEDYDEQGPEAVQKLNILALS